MTDVRGLAVQAVALKVLSERVKERSDAVKAELAASLDVGDRKTATLDDSTKVGSISYAAGKTSAKITNDRALTEWVAERYPDEIMTQVRPAFLTSLLEAAKKAGAAVDVQTGELLPGVELGTSQPYLSVRPDPAGIPALVDAIRASRELLLDGDT